MLPRLHTTGHVDPERAYERALRRSRALQDLETERERRAARVTLVLIWALAGALATGALILWVTS